MELIRIEGVIVNLEDFVRHRYKLQDTLSVLGGFHSKVKIVI